MENKPSFEERLEEANLLLGYREYEKACTVYEELISEGFSSAELFNNYGLTLFYLDKFDDALKEFEKAIEFNNTFALPYSNIGLVYLNQQKYNKAVDFFLKALNVAPDNPETHYNLAVSYYRMGKKMHSLKHYELFIEYAGDKYNNLKKSVLQIIKQIKEESKKEEISQL